MQTKTLKSRKLEKARLALRKVLLNSRALSEKEVVACLPGDVLCALYNLLDGDVVHGYQLKEVGHHESGKQMDLLGGEAKPRPLRAPANIESEARAMLEDFEQGRICVVGRTAPAKDAAGNGLGKTAPKPDVADHLPKPGNCLMCKQGKELFENGLAGNGLFPV